ncbi:MAG: transcriptional regulator [Chloroflexota bacterium]|nr:transcriptional regulator [Chloroflexota bacterium]
MPEPFEELASLDRLVHEPARLAILTVLSACESADFLFLQRLTGLTKGNLSSHLSRLEEADLIWIRKEFSGKKPRTIVGLKERGRKAVDQHWERLEALREDTRKWRPVPNLGTP